MYDTQQPYVASYVIVKNSEGKVAFVMRSNTKWMNNHYGLPSGKVEVHESFVEAAIREAKEEVGIDVTPKNLKHALTVHRFSNEDNNKSMQWVDMFFEVMDYRGEVVNAEPHMHSEVAWLDVNDLPENTIPSLAACLRAWANGKNYFEHGFEDR